MHRLDASLVTPQNPCAQNLTMQRELAHTTHELARERAAVESVRSELGARAIEAQDERAAHEWSTRLRRNVKRFRAGLVFKAHRLLYHSTLGLRVRFRWSAGGVDTLQEGS